MSVRKTRRRPSHLSGFLAGQTLLFVLFTFNFGKCLVPICDRRRRRRLIIIINNNNNNNNNNTATTLYNNKKNNNNNNFFSFKQLNSGMIK
jgi:hypothetical protein